MADLGTSYVDKKQTDTKQLDAQEMDQFASEVTATPGKAPMEINVVGGNNSADFPSDKPPEGVTIPGSMEQRRTTSDPLGRLEPKPSEETTAGKVMDNVAEVVPSALKGIHEAVYKATEFVDPLANWLNEHVADLGSYNVDQPKTVAGQVTKSISQFMTGFIPAVKGFKALGIAGKVMNPMMAGAVADFATRGGHEARMADIWKAAGMPETAFTDWMASNKDDSELMGRFKNALEGVGAGAVAESVMGAFRVARSLIQASKAHTGAEAEVAALRDRYGELTPEDIAKHLGDPTKPMIETKMVQPPAIGGKITKAANEVPPIEPGAVIRSTKQVATGAPDFGAHKTTALGDVVATPSTKEPGKYQVTFWDGKAGTSNTTQDLVFNTKEEAMAAFDQAGKGKVHLKEWGGEQFKPQDFETYINFSKIDAPDQVQFAIGKMAEAMKGSVNEAKRGVITQDATKKMADDMGMTVADLLERRKGQPLNAEEALAARQLWTASGEELVRLAKAASGPNAGDLDQFAFRRAMAVHSAIQNEVLGARAETARALAQWKIPAGGGIEKARAIQQVMAAAGGPADTKEMARRLSILAQEGADSGAIARFAQKGWGATSIDAIKEVWVNGLLSSPKTHMVNTFSNTGVALQQIYERAVAGGIRGLVGGEGVKAGESIAMVHGLKSSIRDAFRMAAKSLKTGETGYAFNKVDVTHTNSISAEAFRMSQETSAGRFVDFLGHAATVPGRLLGAEDEFFKTIGYRMEVHAQAFRQATSEGLSGNDFALRMRDLVNDPPEHIRINAADAAMYSTFTNEVGWFGKAIMNLRNSGSPIGQLGVNLVLPFVRTPTNIARYTFERTPFAPLVGQWRADIAAGGARADLALARMSTGTAIMLTAMDYANDGVVSGAGPSDNTQREALLRSGWQPYSIKAGDKWYSYNRADPFGATMGFAASISEAVNNGEINQEDMDEWQEVMAMSIASVSQVVINKTYLSGVSNFVEMMSDPKRYSEGYVNNLVASFTPFAALSTGVETAVDPTQREANSPWQAVEARIAGLSSKLPPRRDLWGAPIVNQSGLGRVYDFMSPAAVRQQDVAPIDREITRLGNGPQRIAKHTTFDGVSISFKQYPEVYDEYVRLAGNDLKDPAWNMGCKDYLNAVVSGKSPMSAVWDILPDEKRRDFITNAVSHYRKLAQQQIMQDPKFAKFAETVNYIKGVHQQSKMPVFGG